MLNLQEYQSKSLMKDYDVNVQQFHIVDKPSDALNAANDLSEDMLYFLIKNISMI